MIPKVIGERRAIDRAWKETIDSTFRKHARPVHLRKGVLLINVDSPGWLYEISLNKERMLNKLTAKLGEATLKEIRLRIGEI